MRSPTRRFAYLLYMRDPAFVVFQAVKGNHLHRYSQRSSEVVHGEVRIRTTGEPNRDVTSSVKVFDVIEQAIDEIDVCAGFGAEGQLNRIGAITVGHRVFRRARHDLPSGATTSRARRLTKPFTQETVVYFCD